ncbi:MAG: hypothetical protein P8X97_03380 [Candidatus Bathyarchaeota archaeon]
MEIFTLSKVLAYLGLLFCMLLIFSLIVSSFAETSGIMWSQTYGSSEEDVCYSLIQSSDGGFVMVGHTKAFDLDGDIWLIKTDRYGNMDWNYTYGGDDWDRASCLVETSDGGYAITGYTYSFSEGFGDYWLIKTDKNGIVQWNQIYGGNNLERANCLVETSDGGFALAGYSNSFGAGEYDFWLVKTNPLGELEWNQTYGGIDKDIAWSLVETSDGGYVIAGDTLSFGAGDHDFLLVKTDSFGNIEWNQTYGKESYDYAYSVVESIDGGYALAGVSRSEASADFWLVKTDLDGQMLWNKTFKRGDHSEAYSIKTLSDGGYGLAGYSHSIFGSQGIDFWLVRTDKYGNLNLNQTFGGTQIDSAFSIIETIDGGYALAGYTNSFGNGNLDFWLVKTDKYGNIPEFESWTILLFVIIISITIIAFQKKLFK